MAERSNDREPEVFERLQRLALHERRRRWDSTRNALTANSRDSDGPGQAAMPTELLTERFDSLEAQLAALARELRRVEHRSAMIALRARLAVTLGLIAAIACMGLWTGTLTDWILRLSR
ncbi:hypothetical protein [Tautonia plasticadhaerens]|uniref:Uncharacterized protein n=1 Tax=Tautonia plasticadhaerens TaxID=2527974 RepID=A0A518GVE2_9BACT|nr:hypothetical protein [Tautonia plasticadhaerens]QDV32556.1 hypothetical protein ElP_03900 [Tautonia plasticadhaerens]